MHNMTQVVDGHTGIEHAIPLARLYDDVVQLWSQTEVGYTPTLGVGYGGCGARTTGMPTPMCGPTSGC